MAQMLKCDAVGCNHVEFIQALTADLIDKPCVICSENLLTAEDYKAALAAMAIIQPLKDIGVLRETPDCGPSEGVVPISINPRADSVLISKVK